MSFVDEAIFKMVNGGKRTITSPIFVKEFVHNNAEVEELTQLVQRVTSDKRQRIETDIQLARLGNEGERNVFYELKNSFVPMLCLHNVRLEYEDYTAQFDFILITRKAVYVLETKRLSGDIEITKDGDFIRVFRSQSGKAIRREGMYSPISQNERHVNILREILRKENLINTFPVKSLVVLANPKTVIDKSQCPSEVEQKLIRYDQIGRLLRDEMADKSNDRDMREKYLYDIAEYLTKNHMPPKYDLVARYGLHTSDIKEPHSSILSKANYGEGLFDSLRQYRLAISKEQGIKPYMVYTNAEMEDLVNHAPKTKEELLQVKGFGQVKVEKYGDDICRLVVSALNSGE